jgi:hypothetical protein
LAVEFRRNVLARLAMHRAQPFQKAATRFVASQAKALPPISLASSVSSAARRAASATIMPALVKVRASEAESPAPDPTMSAVR